MFGARRANEKNSHGAQTGRALAEEIHEAVEKRRGDEVELKIHEECGGNANGFPTSFKHAIGKRKLLL
ncbi:MAG TPA: hypothetical protein VGK77_16345 [Candidatus Binatia bacterium]